MVQLDRNFIFILISFAGLVLTLSSTYVLDMSTSKFEYCLEIGVNASIGRDNGNHRFFDTDIFNNRTQNCSNTAISESNTIYFQILGLIMTLLIPIFTIETNKNKKTSECNKIQSDCKNNEILTGQENISSNDDSAHFGAPSDISKH